MTLVSQNGDLSNSVDINENTNLELTAQNGNISLQNIIHLNTLNLDGGDVAINNGAKALSVNQVTATGDITLTSEGLNLIDTVSGSSLGVDAGAGMLTIGGDIDIAGTSSMVATGITLNGTFVAGGDSVLDAGTGGIDLQGAMTANGTASLTLNGDTITHNGAIAADAGNINLIATNTIDMAPAATTTATTGDINYQADGDVGVASLVATQGTVSLSSQNGAIDNNTGSVNVHAAALVVQSSGNIGSGINNRFNTQVGSMDIMTTGAGSIWLNQTGNVEITRLQATNGTNRVDLVSTANITLNPGSVAADRSSGIVFLSASNGGDILGTVPYDLYNADVTAYEATLLALSGTIGTTSRPIVLDVPESGAATLYATTRSTRFHPDTPTRLDTKGIDVGALGIIQSVSGEQMVEIESLGQIDPAIFTHLKNYSAAEEAIRLPSDQSFDDESEARY